MLCNTVSRNLENAKNTAGGTAVQSVEQHSCASDMMLIYAVLEKQCVCVCVVFEGVTGMPTTKRKRKKRRNRAIKIRLNNLINLADLIQSTKNPDTLPDILFCAKW